MAEGYGIEDWFSGTLGHGLPSDYSITKRSLYDDELMEASKRAFDTYLNSGLGEVSAKFSSGSYEEENAPSKVKEVPCLFKHLEALSILFRYNKPALRLI